jgi:large subunit ribosomal protein L9
MATHVQVILRQDVDKLGNAGELVRVKPGFARNFLLPRGLAALATGENVKQVEHERRIAAANAEKQRKLAEGTAAQIEGLTIELPMQAGEADRLYGSVTSRDIADALASHGITLDRKKLVLPDAIKTLGTYEISAKLGQEVHAKFKLIVTAKSP